MPGSRKQCRPTTRGAAGRTGAAGGAGAAGRIGAAVLTCLALAACGSSAGLTTTTGGGSGAGARKTAVGMQEMQMGQTGTDAAGTKVGTTGITEMPGMNVAGVIPIPTQTLGTADWQGMKITARAMTAVRFVIFTGTGKERVVNPPKNVSFHLMVYLNDAHTNVPIPYAGVSATITRADKIVYQERQWPMISEYMGPHYGSNVALPGSGTYRLSLLISPPVSARHVEYENVWLKPHRVSMTFKWTQPQRS